MANLGRKIKHTLVKVRPPLFDGLSLWDVLSFFFRGIYEGVITTRAGAVSFSFCLALFPGVIFIYMLIAYLPVGTFFQAELNELITTILPQNTHAMVVSAIEEVLSIKRGGLLSITFIAALFFATNGTMSLISNLSISYHKIRVKNFWAQYLSALILTIILTLLIMTSIVALIFSEYFTDWFSNLLSLTEYKMVVFSIFRSTVLILTIFLGISIVYNYGPVRGRNWRFISPGSVLATLLIIGTSQLFRVYVENVSTYNEFYGSIGTLMIMLLWIYVNAFGLIIGFELNASIAGARLEQVNKRD